MISMEKPVQLQGVDVRVGRGDGLVSRRRRGGGGQERPAREARVGLRTLPVLGCSS